MALSLVRFDDVRSFLASVEPYLLAREAENNLPLGLLGSLSFDPMIYDSAPYLVLMRDSQDDRVAAVALMTPPYNLVLASPPHPDSFDLLVRALHDYWPDAPGVIAESSAALRFATAWSTFTGQPVRRRMAERIYKLERVVLPAAVSGQMRRVSEKDQKLLLDWLGAFQLEAYGAAEDPERLARTVDSLLTFAPEARGGFLWEDPQPVCFVGYGRPTRSGMSIDRVYTPPEHRRRGYASVLTAAVTQHLLDSGRSFCTLFTDLSNPTSNSVYQSIGYMPLCDVDEFVFNSKPIN